MIGRVTIAVTLVAITTIAAACDRGETRNTPVTSTSPAGTSTAPSSASASHREQALMRVVNAAPSNLDLFAGDPLLFDGLAFKAVTTYRAIECDRYAFALRPAGMSRAKPLSSNTEHLKDGDYYTAFAMPGDNGPELRVVGDRLDQPASDKARVRIVHAATGAGDLHVRIAGTKDTLLAAFQTVSGYKEVAPIDGAIEVLAGDSSSPIASVNAHLEAGRFYTIVIVGNARAARPEAFLIEDALAP
jgi:hypothetical protein